jgi:hypothetical protein
VCDEDETNDTPDGDETMTDMTIANEIGRQIGPLAFAMMGTRTKVGGDRSLMFDIKGSRQWNKIRITLDYNDTYMVEFFKLGRAPMFDLKDSRTVEGVYCDMLFDIIEDETGLFLTMNARR